MKPYPKYKTTNIPWLQEVPEGWEVISLRKFLIPISEKNQPQMRLLSVVRERGVIERDIENDDNHNVIPEDLSNYKVVKRGQFVMNKMKAWQGSYGVSDYDGIVSPAYYVFDLQFGNKKYFHYGLRSRFFIDLFARFSIGIRTDQWDLPIQKIKEIPVPFPPLSIQAQIVNFLDTKVSAIDRLIDAKRRQIELLKEWKRAAINEELSANYANSRENLISENSRNSRTKIKNVPLKRLLAEPLQYGANESGKEYNENLPRYVRITDITLDGQLKSEGMLSLPSEIAKSYLLKDGDLLLARSGATAGKSFLYKKEYGVCAFAGYLIKARINQDVILPEYLSYFTNSSTYEEWKNSIFIQSTIQNISAEKYNYLEIPIFPLAVQQEIVKKLDIQCAKADNLLAKLQDEISLLAEYKTRLISDVVTGRGAHTGAPQNGHAPNHSGQTRRSALCYGKRFK